MFVVHIDYTAPAESVAPHRPDHVTWLQGAVESGLVSLAGSKSTRDGGVLLSQIQDPRLLSETLAQDPYVIHQVASHRIIEVDVPLAAPGLERLKTPEKEDYDVVIVGYGPVGRVLALQLGRRGYRVAVVERQVKNYPLPRAVHFDDEIARILQTLDASPTQMPHAVEPYNDLYEWRNATGDPLLRLEWRGGGKSGWNTSYFFHQPSVEAYLDEKVTQLETVTLLRGWEAESQLESEDTITLHVRNQHGDRRSLRGKYLVGADGANSKVRQWMETTTTDLGYFHDWLVIDLLPKHDLHFEPPALQVCDPERPTTIVPGGPGRHRFEFMRLEGESKDEIATEARAWELMAPWGVSAENAQIERHAIYTFAARWCDEWRRGRMLLAGDSAHLMPPFAGQGMSSGIRDAANLEWKLDLVLSGRADESILDSYGSERAEHVRHFIERSMKLGEIICLTDASGVAGRDASMTRDLAEGITMPAHPAPPLGRGLFRNDGAGGKLAIQAPVRGLENEGLFDDVFGSGGTLLLRSESILTRLREEDQAALRKMGFKTICLGSTPGESTAVDTTGAYQNWMDGLGADAVLIRPDFYVFGRASANDTSELIQDMLKDLAGPGKAPAQGAALMEGTR